MKLYFFQFQYLLLFLFAHYLALILSSCRLICQLTGEPTVSWYINEVEIRPSPNRRMYIEQNTSILLIVSASYEDSGEYICRAENKEGVSISRASLNVMKRKSLIFGKRFLKIKIYYYKFLYKGSTSNLLCSTYLKNDLYSVSKNLKRQNDIFKKLLE